MLRLWALLDDELGCLMTWFKVDDKLHDHRKARAAGTSAMGVWLLAGSWSADNLTDGFIPAAILPRWGRPRDASRLVEVGLWHAYEQDGEKGWRFHEWDERQPTRAQKMEERAAKVQAGKIGGLASGRSRAQAQAKQSASGQVEPPSRPVPSRPKDSSPSAGAETEFEDWWAVYPRKVAKGAAAKAYKAASKKADAETLVAGLRRALPGWVGKEPDFIPHAATWLNAERWADEAPKLTAVPEQNSWMHRELNPGRYSS